MIALRRIRRDEQGAAAIEMAFALPILIVMIWMFVQLGQVYRAVAGIQQALGEGARLATHLADARRRHDQERRSKSSVYGIGPGDFNARASGVARTTGRRRAIITTCHVTYTRRRTCCCFPDRQSRSVARSASGWLTPAPNS